MISNQDTNKSIVFNEKGVGSKSLSIHESPLPIPSGNEVRIKVHSVGLNRADQLFMLGVYKEQPQFPNAKLGYECSGVVDAVGDSVTKFNRGDKVSSLINFSLLKYSTFQTYAIIPESSLIINHESYSHNESAAMWMSYLTCYFALYDVANLKSGDTILITAASSSVGLGAIQLSKIYGANVIVTTRSKDKIELLKEYGADHVLVVDGNSDLEKSVMEITAGKGVQVVFDAVGGNQFLKLANITSKGGILILYGLMAPEPTPFPIIQSFVSFINLKGYILFEFIENPIKLDRATTFIQQQLKMGNIKRNLVGKVFQGFESIPKAIEYLETGSLFGKIIVEF